MTTTLLKQALDALLCCSPDSEVGAALQVKTVTDIRAHLAQPQAEPVAVHQFRALGCSDWYDGHPDRTINGPYEARTLYTHPAAPVLVGYFYLDEDVWKQARDAKFMAWHTPLYATPVPADEMDAVASKYAHKLALDLECVLSDYNGRWWDTAMNTIGEYRSAMNAIHERESPTFMGEPSIAASPEVPNA